MNSVRSDRLDLLLTNARQGDRDALGELLAEYRKYLIFLARSQLYQHLQAKADPSDLAQEVCLVAHENIHHFQGLNAEEFAGWLRGILANILAMHVRKYVGTKKRNVNLEQQLGAGIQRGLENASGFLQSGLAADQTSASQHLARNEAFLKLAEALENLREDYRRVITLRHVEGLPFAEVAKVMERSTDSVEKLWVRGLAKLKQALQE